MTTDVIVFILGLLFGSFVTVVLVLCATREGFR